MSPSLEERLAQHPFLRGLDGESIEALASSAREERFAPGTYILREGREAASLYLLEQGRVSLEIHGVQHGQIVIETIEAGECLGWSWLFPPYVWHFSGRAIEEVRTLALAGAAVRALCEADHALGYEMMKRVAGILIDRLQATRFQLLDVYGERKRGRA
jgi:CRP/FNR family cyclic AMP-dependent transcriptional regulator